MIVGYWKAKIVKHLPISESIMQLNPVQNCPQGKPDPRAVRLLSQAVIVDGE
jgi:hypothetical protein